MATRERARARTLDPHQRLAAARRLMADFTGRTGVASPTQPPRRYLWTDAHALCNLLALHRAIGGSEYLDLATKLVDQVHETLGRHRPDDERRGWISGLSAADGRAHPTAAGLRIGKPLRERAPNERFDERSEWDRDGQYFHYLTRWMHALARMAQATGEPRYLPWAVELALVAHARFTHGRACDGRRAMYWKMSIDLTRPLVPSMGQHDPLDGLITLAELRGAAASLPTGDARRLDAAIADLRSVWGDADGATEDPLGLGGLLIAAHTLAALLARGQTDDRALLVPLLRGAAMGLRAFAVGDTLRVPAAHRLAFRELGLAIGLQAIPEIESMVAADPARFAASTNLQSLLGDLSRHVPLANDILACWLVPGNQAGAAWQQHRDIDEVMLATALLPDGYLAP